MKRAKKSNFYERLVKDAEFGYYGACDIPNIIDSLLVGGEPEYRYYPTVVIDYIISDILGTISNSSDFKYCVNAYKLNTELTYPEFAKNVRIFGRNCKNYRRSKESFRSDTEYRKFITTNR